MDSHINGHIIPNSSEIFSTKDNIYGYIDLPSPANLNSKEIILTPQYQRMRNIKQLGVTSLVYPGAIHTRYQHCIGTAYMAQVVLNHLRPQIKLQRSDQINVIMAGLIHDLGHGIYSHLFDGEVVPALLKQKNLTLQAINFWTHQRASQLLFNNLVDTNQIDIKSENIKKICNLVTNTCTQPQYSYQNKWIYEIIANSTNSIDVDKFDYLIRDSTNIGIKNIFVNIDQLIAGMRVIDDQICYHQKQTFNVYNLFQSRLKMFKSVYLHRVCTAIDQMMKDVLVHSDEYFGYLDKLFDAQEYVKLTDNVFDEIQLMSLAIKKQKRVFGCNFLEPGDKGYTGIKEAGKILERVKRRDFYRFVGQIRDIQQRKVTVKRILEFQDYVGYGEELKEQDLILKEIKFNFGAGQKNPVDKVHFYNQLALDCEFDKFYLNVHVIQINLIIILRRFHYLFHLNFKRRWLDFIARDLMKIRLIMLVKYCRVFVKGMVEYVFISKF